MPLSRLHFMSNNPFGNAAQRRRHVGGGCLPRKHAGYCVEICSCVCVSTSTEHQPALLWIVQELYGKSGSSSSYTIIFVEQTTNEKSFYMQPKLNNRQYFANFLCCGTTTGNLAVRQWVIQNNYVYYYVHLGWFLTHFISAWQGLYKN